jgi:DNA-binding response OmpR family regulator
MAVILLVEDDPRLLTLLAGVLRRQGYTVQAAEDGLGAIQQLDPVQGAAAPALVLLDMQLPRVDGLGVLQHLAARGLSVPVVAMSVSPEALTRAQAAGAQATLRKPFALTELVEVVRGCLARTSGG